MLVCPVMRMICSSRFLKRLSCSTFLMATYTGDDTISTTSAHVEMPFYALAGKAAGCTAIGSSCA